MSNRPQAAVREPSSWLPERLSSYWSQTAPTALSQLIWRERTTIPVGFGSLVLKAPPPAALMRAQDYQGCRASQGHGRLCVPTN